MTYDVNSNSDASTSSSETASRSNYGQIVDSAMSQLLGGEDNAQQNQNVSFPDSYPNKDFNTSMSPGQVTLPSLRIETPANSIPLHSSNNVQNNWEDEIISCLFAKNDNKPATSTFNEVLVSVQLNQPLDYLSTTKSAENDNNLEFPSLDPNIYDVSFDNLIPYLTTNHVTTTKNNNIMQNNNNIRRDSLQPNKEEELPIDFEDLFISRCESVKVQIQVRVSLTRANFVPTSSFVEYNFWHVCLRNPSIDFQL